MGRLALPVLQHKSTMAEEKAPKVAKAPKVKKAAKPAAHPPYANMIVAAIKALKDKKGSSRQAILKYVVANNKVADADKAAVRVKLALRKLVLPRRWCLLLLLARRELAPSSCPPRSPLPRSPRPRRLRSPRLPRSPLPRRLPSPRLRRLPSLRLPRSPLLRSPLPRRLPRSLLPRRRPRSKLFSYCFSSNHILSAFFKATIAHNQCQT